MGSPESTLSPQWKGGRLNPPGLRTKSSLEAARHKVWSLSRLVLKAQSCLTPFATPCLWDFPGENTEWVATLLQGTSPNPGLNLVSRVIRADLPLSHQSTKVFAAWQTWTLGLGSPERVESTRRAGRRKASFALIQPEVPGFWPLPGESKSSLSSSVRPVTHRLLERFSCAQL